MIRLKDILLEYEDSHKEMLNVLFVVDDASLKKFGFIRHVISQRVIVGDIESADKQDSEQLKDIVLTQASPELDLIVVVSRGIYDKDPVNIIRNFEIITQYTDTINVPVVFFALPTIRFIKDKKGISRNWTEIERIKINTILSHKFNNINISKLDHDEYFRKDGFKFNLNAHLTLYKKLFNKIREFDPTANVKQDIANNGFDLGDVQRKLLKLGYKIDTMEIMKGQYGETTRKAVDNIRKQLGYPPKENLSISLAKAILILTLDKEHNHNIEIDRKMESKCPNPKYPGARSNSAPGDYTGTNGIASKLPLTTVTDVFNNTVTLFPSAATQFVRMMSSMNSAGISTSHVLSFRSYQKQYGMFDWDLYECFGIRQTKKEGNKQALPGHSNHGKGMAVDVSGTNAQDWIRSNGEAYGWSWDEGKASGERWHFRFTGNISTDAQTEIEKGDIEKAIDTGLDAIPGVGGTIKKGKDWVLH